MAGVLQPDQKHTYMLPDPSENEQDDKKGLLKPDAGTEHTTDPQENMEGPLSSLMQNVNEGAKEKGGETGSDKDTDE